MTRAFLLGLAVLFALNALRLASLISWPLPGLFLVAGYGGSLIASFVTAYSAPHDRIFLGIMIALPAALLSEALRAAYAATGGSVDSVGLEGGIILFFFSLSLNTFTSAVGGVIGGLLARRRSKGERTTRFGAG